VIELVYYPKVLTYLDSLPAALRMEVVEALEYLRKFGRSAALPDVRPIATVRNLYETRTQLVVDDRRHTIRVLVMAHTDDIYIACVAGDKDEWARRHPAIDWYETWLPIAVTVYDHMKGQLR
jgi:Phage derived protein Gp49-like (DUF891)